MRQGFGWVILLIVMVGWILNFMTTPENREDPYYIKRTASESVEPFVLSKAYRLARQGVDSYELCGSLWDQYPELSRRYHLWPDEVEDVCGLAVWSVPLRSVPRRE